jgi:hypothetical protein
MDRGLQIRAHAHRQGVKSGTVRVHALKQFTQLMQPVPLARRILFGWRQTHQSAQFQPGKRGDVAQQLPQGAGSDARFAAFTANIDLHADIQRRRMVGTLRGEPLGNAQPVDGMDPCEVLSHGTGLVGLQRTDEVPGGREVRGQR